MTGAPIECFWDGHALRPVNEAWRRRAAKEFTEGEVYHIVNQEPRNMAFHAKYFASVAEAWRNLPEILADQFQSPDHLRYYALIKTGFNHSQQMVCNSHAEAVRLAAFIKPIDEYAVVTVKESVVTVYRAKSQSFKMGKDEFNTSAQAVLEFLAELLQVTPKQLTQAGAHS